MAKQYVKDIKDKDAVKSVFRATKKSAATGKNGKAFLLITLSDKTGELDARVWDDVPAIDAKFQPNDLVTVEGTILLFKGHPQLTVTALEKADAAGVDEADFAAPPKHAPEERRLEPVLELIERIRDPHVRALLRSFLEEEEMRRDFARAPAAKTIHHAHPGGLIEHTLSTMRLAHRIADQYPMADRDLLVAGAFLHDIGKVRELRYGHGQTEYTDEGRLVGHLVMTAQWIYEKSRKIEGFPPALAVHLTHLVVSHHGVMEYGSPKLPMTLEALLVHHIDELDSRVASWLELMERDGGERWTEYQKLYDRHLYKGAPPTAHGRPPVEPRRKKKEQPRREDKPKEERAARPAEKKEGQAERPAEARPQGERPAGERRPDRGERPERPERRERGPKTEAKLTFKPFAALSGPDAPVEEAKPAEAAPEKPAEQAAEAPAPGPETPTGA